jgi:hypothetical protein
MIDLDAIEKAPVATEPFIYFLAERVLDEASLAAIRAGFPRISSSGIHPVDEIAAGPAFAKLVEELRSPELEKLVGMKFGVCLAGKPLMITVRGHAHKRDGRIHTDSADKLITGLLYLNDPNWSAPTGRLRLLRNGSDLEDYIAEVPPNGGTMVMFKRSDRSWHGHHPFEGERRYLMFNWMTSGLTHAKNVGRHRLSSRLKKLIPLA